MGRQMFAQGGTVYPMQEGGMAPMVEPQPPTPMMPDMPPEAMANVDINQAAQGAMQKGLDPEILEGLLGQYSQQMTEMENAEDYETVINSIRGDNLPIDARYAELAGLVGPADAQSTPESVLTLVQPLMLLAAVDQGIGGLAQSEMSAPIEGEMAGGIMSTVNMGEPEGPAPVNFNQGGAVQYMAPGGVAMPLVSPLQQGFNERQTLYNSIIGPQAYDQADLEEEREMTRAQMLFDLAGTALAFATPGERDMSAAQRLAQAATDTQLFEKIGARAKDQMKTERGRKKDTRDEKMKIDLMALQGAEAEALVKSKDKLKAGSSGTPINFTDGINIQTVFKGSPEAAALVKDSRWTYTGPRSLSADANSGPKVQQFVSQSTGRYSKHVVGSEGWGRAMDNDDQAIAGNASKSKTPSTARLTLFNAHTGQTLNPRADDPNVDNLLADGFKIVNTPSITSTPNVSARVQSITNPDTLAAYAGGYLPLGDVAKFEQTIVEMLVSSTRTVNGEQVTTPALPLSGPVLKAIEARRAGGQGENNAVGLDFTMTNFNLPNQKRPQSEAAKKLADQNTPEGVRKVLQENRSANKGTLPRGMLNSPEFNSTLLDNSGRVDLSSESWRMMPKQIFNSGVDYDVARGIATIPTRVATAFGEVAREVGGGRISEDGSMVYQADTDFQALKTSTIGTIANAVSEGRVLKSVQDQINKFLGPLDPGVFKFDAKSRTSLNSIAAVLAMALDDEVAILPEYDGDPTGYSNTDIQTSRKTARHLRHLLAEYVAFGDQMDSFLSGESGVGGRAGSPPRNTVQNMLYIEAQKEQREKEWGVN